MIIHLYCVCRDEAVLMPYLIRHYSTFVDRMFFYDAGSIDGTQALIEACPVAELRPWKGSNSLADDELHTWSNEVWKESRHHADWVIVIDADEFLYHPSIRYCLEVYRNNGITVPLIDGYTMVSDKPPTTAGQIYDEIKTGFPDAVWAKRAIFNPMVEMHYNPGRHSITDHFTHTPSPAADIKLLHYRALGLDYLRARHARNWARVPQRCRQRSYGVNTSPGHTGHHGVAWFEDMMKQPLQNVI